MGVLTYEKKKGWAFLSDQLRMHSAATYFAVVPTAHRTSELGSLRNGD